jgi:hypothetical protein
LSLSPDTQPEPNPSVQPKLTIKRESRVISWESILEIKTRVFHKSLKLSEIAPQLWISQTPKLVRAYHQRGKFSPPKVENVAIALKREQTHQDDIKKLIALINCILRVTRNLGGNSTIRYGPLKDKLVVKKTERKKMLPDNLYSNWVMTIPVSIPQKISKPGAGSTRTEPKTWHPAGLVQKAAPPSK